MRIQLPAPSSWDDFEHLALQLWRSIWDDHNAQMHGRHGQPQWGVDVFGQPFGSQTWEGVQCKGKDRLTRAKVSKSELQGEIAKAAKFLPRLGAFVLATTAPRDGVIQAEANRLSSLATASFRTSVWSWDDIEDELNIRDYLLPMLYPQFLGELSTDYGMGVLENRLYLFRAQPLDKSFAFLSHPELQKLFSAAVRVDIRNLVFEMSLNAFQHGTATRVGVTVSRDGSFELVDDGAAYDPLAKQPAIRGGVGFLYLKLFIEKYKDTFSFTHSRTGSNENKLAFTLTTGASLQDSISSEIVLFDTDALMPSRARYIARTAVIPAGYDTLELHISSMVFSPSSFFEFLRELLSRLPPETRIRVFCGQHDMLARCLAVWNSDGETALFKGRFEIVEENPAQ